MNSSNNNSVLNRSSSRYIKLQIQYGSDIYELLLSSKNTNIQVEHILDEIEKLTKVPKCHQSLIYKGQRLDQKPKANLDDLYIFNNSKLILTGTQKRFHDKYCCPDHDHHIDTSSLSKPISSQQQNIPSIHMKKENSTKNIVNSSVSETQSTLTVPKKQDIQSNLTGFVPEPNKTYEYYTVPYKTDPATLLQTIPLSTSSNTHS